MKSISFENLAPADCSSVNAVGFPPHPDSRCGCDFICNCECTIRAACFQSLPSGQNSPAELVIYGSEFLDCLILGYMRYPMFPFRGIYPSNAISALITVIETQSPRALSLEAVTANLMPVSHAYRFARNAPTAATSAQ